MAVDVIMPQMGESIFEGTITKWLKKAGDKIERDEPLFEISTDKVDAEIPSPSAGVLKEIKVSEGQTVPIQTVVAVIDAGDGAVDRCASPRESRARSPRSSGSPPQPVAPPPAASSAAPRSPPAVRRRSQSPPPPRRVKKFAALRSCAASRAKIILTLRRFPAPAPAAASARATFSAPCEGGSAPPASAPLRLAPAGRPSASGGGSSAPRSLENAVPREKMYFGHYEVQPMSVMRQRIAEHMVLSKRVSPHVYSVDEADITAIAAPARQDERRSSNKPPAPSSRSCLSSCAPPWKPCAPFPP